MGPGMGNRNDGVMAELLNFGRPLGDCMDFLE